MTDRANPASTRSNICCIIVDPYSSGALLAEALVERGAQCIAVESSPQLPEAMKSRFNPAAFLQVIRHDLDLDRSLEAVRPYHPTHVIAGFESGVELAEQLGQRLKLTVNEPQLREARRDKFLMSQAVRAQGLKTAQQFRSSRIQDLLDWIRSTLAWPVIVKPLKSVATDQVFCCQSAEEVRRSAQLILSANNVLGQPNQQVLVQEFLAGREYAVDVVSLAGQKKTTAIWEYRRPPAAERYVGYDAMILLSYTGQRQQALEAYACQVLDALGIGSGPTHCELMWVDGQPVLIEVGCRLTAGNNAILSRVCGGICQLDKTVEAILEPASFSATRAEIPCLKQRAANVFLAPHRPGRLIRVHGLEIIRSLPTLHYLSLGAKPGDQLGRVAGLVTLIDEDIQAIERDLDVIRQLESEGIFEVE